MGIDTTIGYRTSATGRIPADPIEEVVVNLVLQAVQSPESVQVAWRHVRAQFPEIVEPTAVLATRRLAEVWKQLFPAEQVRLVNEYGHQSRWHSLPKWSSSVMVKG